MTGSTWSHPGRRSARRCKGHKAGDTVSYEAPTGASLDVELVAVE